MGLNTYSLVDQLSRTEAKEQKLLGVSGRSCTLYATEEIFLSVSGWHLCFVNMAHPYTDYGLFCLTRAITEFSALKKALSLRDSKNTKQNLNSDDCLQLCDI